MDDAYFGFLILALLTLIVYGVFVVMSVPIVPGK